MSSGNNRTMSGDDVAAGAGSFGGFGAAPPNIAAVSDAGVATTASRSDHTHGLTAAVVAAALAVGTTPVETAGGIIVVAYLSPIIDLTAIGVTNLMPALPGYYGVVVQNRFLWRAKAGTYTTPPTSKMGNNGTRDNVLTSGATQPPVASFTNAVPSAGPASAPTVTNGATLVDLTTPIALEITAGATGVGLTAQVRMLLTLSLFPVAGF